LEAFIRIWNGLVMALRPPDGLTAGAIGALHNPQTAMQASLLLTVAAFAGLIWYAGRRIWPAHRLILMATRAVEGTADQPAFTASFPRFDRAINETPLLQRPWGQFRAGIIVPPQSARAAVRHHLRAGDYLHLAGLEAGGFNFRFFASWPGFFFANGVVISLLGIAADLHLAAQSSLTGGLEWDIAAAGLSTKLLPLLAGAITGLCLAVTYHWAEQRLGRDLFRLSHVLEQRIQFTFTRPASEQVRLLTGAVGGPGESPAEFSMIPEQLRALSQEIVAALARVETQMTETMPGRVGDAMQPLSDALDMLGKRLSDSNADALRQAVGELSQGLHARAVEDLDALSDALAQARGGLEDAGRALRDSTMLVSEKLNDASEALAEQVGRASQHAQQAFDPLPAQVAEFGQALSAFNEGLSQHTASVASAAETSHRAIRMLDELMQRAPLESAQAIAPAVMLQGQTPVMNILMVEDLSRAARDMSSSLEAVSEARRLLKRLGSRLRQPATALLAEDWDKRHGELTESDDVLNEVLENFRAGASQQRAGLDATIEELENRLERLFRDLDTGASRLDGAIQTIRRQAMISPVAETASSKDNESESAA